MIDPAQSDIGRSVVYLAGTDRSEEGVITSFNDAYVFVRYGSDKGSKATRRADLIWVREPSDILDDMGWGKTMEPGE